MNVLHLCAGNMYGGVERLLVTLARLRGVGRMRPVFAPCFEGQLSAELREAGAGVHLLGAVRASRPWTVWLARRRLSKLLKANRFDLVVAHACWPLAMFGKAVGGFRREGRRLPLVLWAHDILKNDNWIETRAAKIGVDLVLANSRATAESVKSVFPKARTQWEYLPVAAPEIGDKAKARADVRAELKTPAEAAVIVCASRLERWKGHAVLIEALGQLTNSPNWECWIAGGAQRPHEHEYLLELRASADRLGIGQRVKFLGQRKDIPHVLAAADIHCQPNTGPEPFGIAFVEAMYAGLPIVTSAIGGALELIDQSAGVLVNPGDVAGLTESLRELIDNPARRNSLGYGGMARARALCDPETVMARLESTLASAMETESNLTKARGAEVAAA